MKLVEVDLTKAVKQEHPDIILDEYYLAEVRWKDDKESTYILGKFDRQWYGLNFDWFWSASSLQFDAPGYNNSKWKRLWKLEVTP